MVREFLAQFQGNEFIIALIFFAWLILGGTGTKLSRLCLIHFTVSRKRLAFLSLLLCSCAVLQILALRFFRDEVFIHGTSVGFYQTLATIFLVIGPYGLLDGFVLPYSLFLLRKNTPDYPGARMYMLDNIGDVSGGALFSFILVTLLSPLQAVFWAHLPLLLATLFLFYPHERKKPRVILALLSCLALLASGLFLEKISLTPDEGELVHYQESRYGRITVLQDQEQFTLFADGSPLFSNQNQSQAEETVHFAMSQTNGARSVLFIGAEGGMLKEVEKYQPQQVDYLELDRELSTAQLTFGLLSPIQNLHIIHQDGRSFLSHKTQKYDVIISNMPEPDTFQINRYFTTNFFENIKNHLHPGGVFSLNVAGYDNYLAEAHRQKVSSLYNSLIPYFRNVILLPGQKIFFLCSDGQINPDIPGLLTRQQIATDYISSYYSGNISQERINSLVEVLDPSTPSNHDMEPFLMQIMFKQWFSKFSTTPLPFILVLALCLVLYFTRCRGEELVLFSTGFLTMGSEILVIFVYQILFGFIYEQIGVIVTVFLAGLLPGAWYGEKIRRIKSVKKFLLAGDVVLICLMGALLILLTVIPDKLPVAFFLCFGFLISLICGFQFPLALCFGGDDNRAATRTFSADLIGAAFGTLLTSLYLIPFLGVSQAIIGLIIVKSIGSVVLQLHHEKA